MSNFTIDKLTSVIILYLMPLSTPEFAKKLKVSRVRIYEMCRDGIIKCIRVGRSYIIEDSELSRFRRVKRGKVYRLEEIKKK